MTDNPFDLFIIGGGINGTGIAAEASRYGVRVGLCEQADLASATSSASSKLIHGGLRYLEHYEFRLVKEALAEREVLLKAAPHLISPLRFVLPHRPHLRPAWMIRMGLFMYDHLSQRNQIPGSKSLTFENEPNNPLANSITRGFEYYDCQVDDARLVVANALLAQQNGAQIHTQTACIGAQRKQGLWHITLQDKLTGTQHHCTAKALVNAAGPWAQSFIENQMQATSPRQIRLIKGSHFVTKKLYEGDHAYILQNEDQRIVFVIPYQNDYSLVGTTDKEYQGDPSQVSMDDEEESYLVEVINQHFKQPITQDDILWRYSGVRPLCDDESDSPSATTRDYTLELNSQDNTPLLSIFGGKITTYRRLALSAMAKLRPFLPQLGSNHHAAPLPGGDLGETPFEVWAALIQQQYHWLPADLCQRWCKAYGTRIHELLEGCESMAQLGRHFGADLYEKEVLFLQQTEWAHCAEDILWRRSKLGLQFHPQQVEQLERFLQPDTLQQAG